MISSHCVFNIWSVGIFLQNMTLKVSNNIKEKIMGLISWKVMYDPSQWYYDLRQMKFDRVAQLEFDCTLESNPF